MGTVERALLQQGLRYSLGLRFVVVGVSSSVTQLLTTPPDRTAALVAVIALNVWNLCYAAVLVRDAGRSRRWAVPLDVAVMCGLGLTQTWTVSSDPGDPSTWIGVAIQVTVVTYAWQINGPALTAATLTIVSACHVGTILANPVGPSADLVIPLWTSVEAALAWGLYRFVRRSARAADQVVERGEQLRRVAEVATARRADEREYLAALHDTASATLLMVGSGVVAQRETWLAAQARRHLQEISGPDVTARGELDLLEVLRDVVGHTQVRVIWSGPDTLPLPAVDAVSLGRGVREALTNVVRHAGTDLAQIQVRGDSDAVTVQIIDEGRGFDPAQTSEHRYGLTRSLVERMARSGGSARIDSRPGRGTTVTMTCPRSGPEPQDDDAEIIATSFQRGLRGGVVVMTLAIVVLLDLPRLLSSQFAEIDVRPQFVEWVVLFSVTLVVAVATWRDRPLGRWRWPLLVLVFASSMLARSGPAGVPTDGRSLVGGNAGWQVLLLMLDTRVAVLVAVLVAQYVMTWGYVAWAGPAGQGVAGALNATWIVLSFQLAVAMIAAVLHRLAVDTARVARADEQVRTSEAVARHLHGDRTRRFAELAVTTVPLLKGLASGELDPQQESVRRRCAAEAARMRRLFAEDAVSDPLAHELRACIELAEGNGVSVSFAECGTRPALPARARRRLTEPAIAVLATARGTVRLTVAGTQETVTVSVIAECPPLAPMPDSDGVHLSTMLDGSRQWIQATWSGGTYAHRGR